MLPPSSERDLFTTAPLSKPCDTQQTPTYNLHGRYSPRSRQSSRSATPSQPLSRANSIPLDSDPLCFAKIPIDSSRSCAPFYTSTDSENVSSDWDLSSRQGYGGSRSPSLLTCLIQARPQPPRTSSTSVSSSSCQPTPVTPHCNATATTFFSNEACAAKPILRRSSASAYTSASEDGMVTKISALALNLESGLEKVSESLERVGKPLRSCTLKFAVNPCSGLDSRPTSNSNSRSSSMSQSHKYGTKRRDNQLPVWEDDEDDEDEDDEDEEDEDDSPFVEPESESDEGYREDEEDGFTSDEDIATSSMGPSRRPSQMYSKQMAWAESSNWASKFSMISAATMTRKRRQSPVPSHSTEVDENLADSIDDLAVSPKTAGCRGRQIRVKDLIGRSDKSGCTRHRSPPPKSLSPAPAPPAARSPSAAELCRRRTGILSPTPGVHNSNGWRSDDPAHATYQGPATAIHRHVSLAAPKASNPILRRTPTAPSRCLSKTSPSSPNGPERRISEPEALRRGSLPTGALLSDSVAVGEIAFVGQGEDVAKLELEKALGIHLNSIQ